MTSERYLLGFVEWRRRAAVKLEWGTLLSRIPHLLWSIAYGVKGFGCKLLVLIEKVRVTGVLE